MMPVPKKKKKLENFNFALGIGMDWVDLDNGVIYHFQEYKEAMDRGENPKGIRMTLLKNGETIGYADEYAVEKKMKDPEPDPKYEAESLKEYRRNF